MLGQVPSVADLATRAADLHRPGGGLGLMCEQEKPGSRQLNRRAAANGESRMLINGELTTASDGRTFPNSSPATGEVLGHTSSASRTDMERAIHAAREAFDHSHWSTDRALRKRCLSQLQDALEREREQLRDELVAEVGAPLMTTAMAQLDWPLLDNLRFPAGLIDTFEWERELGPGPTVDNRRRVIKEPVGVVGAIVPWNYPLELTLTKLGQALATGNTVVLKPDPNTPWSSTRIGRLITECTDIPPGVVNVIPTAENSTAEMLVTDARVDMISFTGSSDVGRHIAGLGSQTLKRVFLELGGKSAMVVLEDADADEVVPNTLQVCFHAGQGCAINTRLLVPQRMFDAYAEKVCQLLGSIRPGDPARPDTLLGPVINAKQRDRILGFIDRAKAAGAEIAVGGDTPTDLDDDLAHGTYVSPTLILGADNADEIARCEVFGPVLVMLPYRDEAHALEIANDSEYGLSGSVYSGSSQRAMDFARRVRAGSMMVNGGLFHGADAPYGGYKASGYGRQNGLEGFEQHLETKTIGYR
jgi:aldehyde dehydrogenase (NAD+)